MNATHLVNKVQDLFAGEDGGKAFGVFGGGGEDDGIQVLVEDFPIEEEESREGLILSGGGDVSCLGEVGQEGLDFRRAHFGGVAFVVEKDEAADPVHVRVFGTDRVVFEADGVSDTSTSSCRFGRGVFGVWVPFFPSERT